MTRPMRQVLLLTAFVLALAGVSPAAALAGPIVDRAVAGLAEDPVYVDPAAEDQLDAAGADRVRDRIADFGGGDFGGGGDF